MGGRLGSSSRSRDRRRTPPCRCCWRCGRTSTWSEDVKPIARTRLLPWRSASTSPARRRHAPQRLLPLRAAGHVFAHPPGRDAWTAGHGSLRPLGPRRRPRNLPAPPYGDREGSLGCRAWALGRPGGALTQPTRSSTYVRRAPVRRHQSPRASRRSEWPSTRREACDRSQRTPRLGDDGRDSRAPDRGRPRTVPRTTRRCSASACWRGLALSTRRRGPLALAAVGGLAIGFLPQVVVNLLGGFGPLESDSGFTMYQSVIDINWHATSAIDPGEYESAMRTSSARHSLLECRRCFSPGVAAEVRRPDPSGRRSNAGVP